ncbi:MAG: redoxin domain-containing protein [Chloroflexota bacterium]
MSENSPPSEKKGPNLPLVIGGFVLLGIAFMFILFGGQLFSSNAGETAVSQPPSVADQLGGDSLLEQVPAFEEAEGETAVLPSGFSTLQIGDTVPDFTLQDLDGNATTLSSLEGQPVIINFWATWCAPCRIEMPELQAIYDAHKDDGLVILALDQEEPPDVVRSFFYDEMGLTFTPLLDTDGQIAQIYGAVNFPTTIFISPEGEMTALHRGPMVESQIEGYLLDTDPTLFEDG